MRLLKKYSFLMIYLLLILPFIGLYLGGWATFFPFLIIFVFIPFVDAFIRDPSNPTKEQEKKLIKDNYFKYLTYTYVFAQIIMLAYGAYIVTTQHLLWNEWLGFTMSLGLISGGAGINLAHEMMHKNNSVAQFYSKVLLVIVCYGHFFIEHVKGHHVRVATPEDPATAQLGESFYQFLPKTLIGSFKSALHLEKKRLSQKKYSLWSIHNNFWWIIGAPVAISLACLLFGTIGTLAFFLLQSFMAILTLEVVNYIEHYGLERKKLANGGFEKVNPYHSWNANHWLSNSILFHLQRHSDHHTYGARPYQILRHMQQSPQLPSGYLGMIVLALIPPLWRAVMDKRVIEYRKQLEQQELYGEEQSIA
ncbi:alkane 1-monooxygenase [uncultured Legionella sp.]|uniref:alkane 1-monooxygenase n=1 Tax=uncultured Legionella sp. TaxID=210934 RepID=UPI00262839A8|nr:alkane 1-monooxygenase [uncultured Legionella sp.]